jgi:phosphatidylserine/phosphatidylglycerophosphate/cardiolipin synthase-like enzyme
MHSNCVVATDQPDANSAALVSSANLTRSNTQRHYNATVAIRSPAVAAALARSFDTMWAGDFKRSTADVTIPLSDGSECSVLCGASGETLTRSAEVIDDAQETVDFAMFTLARGNEAFDALLRALARGVRVRGVVDGDQVNQPWDAVPALRGAGGDVRYTPGVLTGGEGRMHQKTMVVDGRVVMVSTGNWSAAARSAHEAAVVVATSAAMRPWLIAQYVKSEIDRLFDLSPSA